MLDRPHLIYVFPQGRPIPLFDGASDDGRRVCEFQMEISIIGNNPSCQKAVAGDTGIKRRPEPARALIATQSPGDMSRVRQQVIDARLRPPPEHILR
jgi:hypothetical protein